MTDAASSVKYWYLIRIMGRDPSHIVLEAALQTNPNHVIISEECAQEGMTLPKIVNKICNLITKRSEDGKDFGCILIPEGLLSQLAHYRTLIEEINDHFDEDFTYDEIQEKNRKFLTDPSYVDKILSPWSASVFHLCPEFFQKSLILEREKHGKIQPSQIETEKLIAYFIEKELKRRTVDEGAPKIPFTAITHYFGYQGRGSQPSLLDCNLASTYGFTAAVLIMNNITACVTTARGLTDHPSKWKVGGVPIISLLAYKNSEVYGRSNLQVPSEMVDTRSGVFQRLKAQESEWEMKDRYRNPGPIQLFGHGKDMVNKTLYYTYGDYAMMVNDVKDLCKLIQRDTTFIDDPQLLVAAISSLKSAKDVLNSFDDEYNYKGAHKFMKIDKITQ